MESNLEGLTIFPGGIEQYLQILDTDIIQELTGIISDTPECKRVEFHAYCHRLEKERERKEGDSSMFKL